MSILGTEPTSYKSLLGISTATVDYIVTNAIQTQKITLTTLTPNKPVLSNATQQLVSGNIALGSQVSGILPIANGGTASSAALANNYVMISDTNKIVEGNDAAANVVLNVNSLSLPGGYIISGSGVSGISLTANASVSEMNIFGGSSLLWIFRTTNSTGLFSLYNNTTSANVYTVAKATGNITYNTLNTFTGGITSTGASDISITNTGTYTIGSFSSTVNLDAFIMNIDGSGSVNLTDNASDVISINNGNMTLTGTTSITVTSPLVEIGNDSAAGLYGFGVGSGVKTVGIGSATAGSTLNLVFTGGTLSTYATSTQNNTVGGIWASSKSVTFKFQLVGSFVSLQISSVSAVATISSTITTITAIPAAYRPINNQFFPICIVDNALGYVGMLQVASSGTLTFYLNANQDPFSGAGSSGFQQTTVTYAIN